MCWEKREYFSLQYKVEDQVVPRTWSEVETDHDRVSAKKQLHGEPRSRKKYPAEPGLITNNLAQSHSQRDALNDLNTSHKTQLADFVITSSLKPSSINFYQKTAEVKHLYETGEPGSVQSSL